MSFHHDCFEPRTTPVGDGAIVKDPSAPNGEDFGHLKANYAAQAILTATNDLLDCALRADSLDDALELAQVVKLLRERIDAITNQALDRANALCNG